MNTDTLYVQANDLSGSFPGELYPCPACLNDVVYFGFDCAKVECTRTVCNDDSCFLLNNTITTKQ